MRRNLTLVAVAAGLSIVPASAAFATTNPDDPDDVAAVDNPADENDDDGFDDWGLLGLLGLLGLGGLAGRRRVEETRSTYVTPGSTDLT